MSTTTTPTLAAEKFAADAARLGFVWNVKPGTVTIRATFRPGDRDAYVRCDSEGPALLDSLPTSGAGSTWGTDGGSLGGAVGLANGSYRLNRSGISKRFTTALAKIRN